MSKIAGGRVAPSHIFTKQSAKLLKTVRILEKPFITSQEKTARKIRIHPPIFKTDDVRTAIAMDSKGFTGDKNRDVFKVQSNKSDWLLLFLLVSVMLISVFIPSQLSFLNFYKVPIKTKPSTL